VFNSGFRYAADIDWFLRLSVAGSCEWIPEITSKYRQHTGQLSSDLEGMLNEGFIAWKDVLRANHISQLRVIMGVLIFVPAMRYRFGGIRKMLSFPRLSCLRNILFRR
jgi:hypothetical protein